MQQCGAEREVGIDGKGVAESELGDVEHCVLIGGADDAHQVVDHLGETQGGQHCIATLEKMSNLWSCGFATEDCDHAAQVVERWITDRVRGLRMRPVGARA